MNITLCSNKKCPLCQRCQVDDIRYDLFYRSIFQETFGLKIVEWERKDVRALSCWYINLFPKGFHFSELQLSSDPQNSQEVRSRSCTKDLRSRSSSFCEITNTSKLEKVLAAYRVLYNLLAIQLKLANYLRI